MKPLVLCMIVHFMTTILRMLPNCSVDTCTVYNYVLVIITQNFPTGKALKAHALLLYIEGNMFIVQHFFWHEEIFKYQYFKNTMFINLIFFRFSVCKIKILKIVASAIEIFSCTYYFMINIPYTNVYNNCLQCYTEKEAKV